MLKSFSAIWVVFVVAAAVGCGKSSDVTPITPTVGTVATAQGTVMLSGSYIPLAGVVVTIAGVTLTTGFDGTFAVSGLKPGNATLTAERQGFQKFSERVFLEGAKTFNIFLSPADLRSLP
jgi:hypothetical protein